MENLVKKDKYAARLLDGLGRMEVEIESLILADGFEIVNAGGAEYSCLAEGQTKEQRRALREKNAKDPVEEEQLPLDTETSAGNTSLGSKRPEKLEMVGKTRKELQGPSPIALSRVSDEAPRKTTAQVLQAENPVASARGFQHQSPSTPYI